LRAAIVPAAMLGVTGAAAGAGLGGSAQGVVGMVMAVFWAAAGSASIIMPKTINPRIRPPFDSPNVAPAFQAFPNLRILNLRNSQFDARPIHRCDGG
jgi:hypothetical protein